VFTSEKADGLRGARELVILLRLDIVRGFGDVHERANGEDNEHEREAVREQGLVGRWAGVGIVELRVDLDLERLRRYRSVPGSEESEGAARGVIVGNLHPGRMGIVDIAKGSSLCAGGKVPEEAAQGLALGGWGDGRDGERGGASENVGGKHAVQACKMVILRLLLLRRLVL
jgi:hypothetical protein